MARLVSTKRARFDWQLKHSAGSRIAANAIPRPATSSRTRLPLRRGQSPSGSPAGGAQDTTEPKRASRAHRPAGAGVLLPIDPLLQSALPAVGARSAVTTAVTPRAHPPLGPR